MRILQLQIVIILLLSLQELQAQDAYFSQFSGNKLYLNPALSGLTNNNARFATSYRNTWSGVIPSTTYIASAEMNIGQRGWKKGYSGFGLDLFRDVIGSQSDIKKEAISLSSGYHHRLSQAQFLSFGVRLSIYQYSLDFSNLIYKPNDYIHGNYDPLGNSISYSNSFVDLSTGLFYFQNLVNVDYYFGWSMFHILRPNQSDLGVQGDKLAIKHSLHGGFTRIRHKKLIMPQGLIMVQGGSFQMNIGSYWGFQISEYSDFAIMAGGFVRTVHYSNGKYGIDAFIPALRLNGNKFDIGIAYDIDGPGTQQRVDHSGNSEIFLVYSPRFKINRRPDSGYCPEW